jgi:hypothetical protein
MDIDFINGNVDLTDKSITYFCDTNNDGYGYYREFEMALCYKEI